MVIDTSAIVAILLGEPEADALANAIVADPRRYLSALNALESAIVMEVRKGPAGSREFDLLLHASAIDVVPLDAAQVELARAAYRKFGEGRHAARLNIGDCCAYALAQSIGQPLLFKGDDFSKTDVAIAHHGSK